MKKIVATKKPVKAKNSKSVQKLGLVLGALESKIVPGTYARPVTCIRNYCLL